MKKLLTSALVLIAASLFAVKSPAPEPYCDCIGIGKPQRPLQHLNAHTGSRISKSGDLGFAAHTFYELEVWMILFGPGIYK